MPKPKLFISNCSQDRAGAEEIHRRLAGHFDVRRDPMRIETSWPKDNTLALADADLVCLMWSENSSRSTHVKHEWLTARALEKRILLCMFPGAPALPLPLHDLRGIPFSDVEEGYNQLIKWIKAELSSTAKYDYTILPGNSHIPFNPLPSFTGRHADLIELYLKMIGNLNKIGINQVESAGLGGIGKTRLAVEFARRFSFGFHGIYWIQAVEPDRWLPEFVSIARNRLHLEIRHPDSPEAARQYIFALKEYFRAHPDTLVIMDDVTEPELLNDDTFLFGLTPLTLGCNVLFTTRKRFQVTGVQEYSLNLLSSEAAYDLLTSYRAPATPEEEEYARAIGNAAGCLPLAIALAGAYLKQYEQSISFADYHAALVRNKLVVSDVGNMGQENLAKRHAAAVRATLRDHWEMLKDEHARHLLKLAGQFPEAAIIPKARLRLLAGIDQPLARTFNHLHTLCLMETMESDASAVRLHPLVREFAFDLVSKEQRGVFRETAAQNLKAACFKYERLDTEIQDRGVQSIIDDCKIALDWWEKSSKERYDLELLENAIRCGSHVISHDPNQLSGHLTGRLMEEESPGIHGLLNGAWKAKRGPWLRPLRASLVPSGGPLIRTLVGHTGWVNTVAVTPDGRRAVSGSGDKTLRVWELESGRELRILEGHTDRVDAAVVAPDGRRAVSGSWDKTLKVWDLETGREIWTLEGHAGGVRAVAVTPDGRRAVSGSKDKTLKVWNIETGRQMGTLEGHAAWVNAVVVTPDGRRAVSGSGDNTLRVWDLESGRQIKTLEGHVGGVDAVVVTPDGKRAVSGSDDKTLRVWDLEAGKELRALEGHARVVGAVAVTPDGRRAVSGSWDWTLRAWDLETGREIRTLEGHTGGVDAVAVTPDGRRVVSGSGDKTLRVWDIKLGKELRCLEEHVGGVDAVTVTPDGRRAVSGSWDETLRVWDLESGREIRTLKGHAGGIRTVVVTTDGGRSVSGSLDGTLRVWDLESGREIRTLAGHAGGIRAVAVTPDGRRAVSGSADKTLRVWDLESGREIRILAGHTDMVDTVAVTPDGRRAVSGSWDKTLRVWDLESGREIRTLAGHTHRVDAVAVTPDGRRAVSGSADKTLRVWDLESGRQIKTLEGHVGGVDAVVVTPDGKRAVSGSDDKTLRVWDLESGREIRTLAGHTHRVDAVAVTPDGRRAVSGSWDKTLRVWNLESGKELCCFTGESGIRSCAVTPDGKKIVAGEPSGQVHLLKIEGLDP